MNNSHAFPFLTRMVEKIASGRYTQLNRVCGNYFQWNRLSAGSRLTPYNKFGGGLFVGIFTEVNNCGASANINSIVGDAAITAVSCGGVVIFKGKVLLLYKNQNGKYMGWVMPKGTLECDETHKHAALREVKEETGVTARVIKYIGKTQYSFQGSIDLINKTVHWYLMTTDSFYCKPQAEEYFADVGFYKQHEAYHLLKFHDEKQIMRRAYTEYARLRRTKEWNGNNKLFFNSGHQ